MKPALSYRRGSRSAAYSTLGQTIQSPATANEPIMPIGKCRWGWVTSSARSETCGSASPYSSAVAGHDGEKTQREGRNTLP